MLCAGGNPSGGGGASDGKVLGGETSGGNPRGGGMSERAGGVVVSFLAGIVVEANDNGAGGDENVLR